MQISSNVSEFLNKQNLPENILFDATDMKRSVYSHLMKDQGKLLAIGVTECKKGHSLRTRHGHCVFCRPASFAYMIAYHRRANLYIAGSKATRMLKIGISANLDKRKYSLNDKSYLGTNDWTLLYSIEMENAGKFEKDLHDRLKKYNISVSYIQNGIKHESREFFNCNFQTALGMLNILLIEEKIEAKNVYLNEQHKEYEFDGNHSTLDRDLLCKRILEILQKGKKYKARKMLQLINKQYGTVYQRQEVNSVLYRELSGTVKQDSMFQWGIEK